MAQCGDVDVQRCFAESAIENFIHRLETHRFALGVTHKIDHTIKRFVSVLDCVLGELPPQQVQRPVRRHDFGALLAVLGAMRTARASLLETKIPERDLLEKKVLIANDLLNRPFPKRKIRAIFNFLESYVLFEEPKMNRIFKERTKSPKKNAIMNMTEFVRQEALEEGLKKGRTRGRAEGREKGRAEERKKLVRTLLANTRLSVEKIAELVGGPLALVERLERSVRNKR